MVVLTHAHILHVFVYVSIFLVTFITYVYG